ncbi:MULTISPECIES: hypothetical protein [unclassified Mesorhizobium]|uniref:hypothetical protein n=1 Tax=unclassified Mesorhizobium TaxID=325217 RepID=UPI0003CE64EF|nr:MULTISPECIES: hypothetical protein [unclassified Mesorhizobium]ESX29463.1 hypothetical protein X765_14225 [Mesorhizobium sp. LSHC440B00]ESX37766.1 hypothetical protein X763_12710 [Mesorhizobium sp. LSHC432A00]ESX43273.1 hypothetical protein X764_08010 [Mesorhizobium sp. LSHC440A00]ESY48075.1 hypothetical protein X746_11355 [Mesorhizobium sp. LNJC380A00]WJI57395.1 hypothetical protein NLY33_01140 [Mesorhizobium sp. C432A]
MCRVDGCYRAPTKFSHLCEYHRNVDRVHGDPRQRGVTKTELKPYQKAIRDYLARRSGPRAEAVIMGDWDRVTRRAEEFLEAGNRGRPQNVHERRAAQMIVSVGKDYHAMEIAILCMALGYFYADQPRRWASDRGFQYQAARMLRRLAQGETDFTWRPEGTMVRSSTKRCPPSVTRALWSSIEATNFIGYGIQIRREIEKGREQKRKDHIADLREILGPGAFAVRSEAA